MSKLICLIYYYQIKINIIYFSVPAINIIERVIALNIFKVSKSENLN